LVCFRTLGGLEASAVQAGFLFATYCKSVVPLAFHHI